MINIFSIQFNDANYLRWQYKTFQHFCKDAHKLICINNSYDKYDEKEQIRRTAEELGIEHHLPQNVNNAKGGWAHQTAINWAWHTIAKHNNDINIFLDHDMFLIDNFSCEGMQEDIWGIMQGREGKTHHIEYLHPAFIVLNRTLQDKDTIDFTGEEIDGVACDSGGNWYHYIQKHPGLKIKGLCMPNICSEQGNLQILPPDVREEYDEFIDPLQICEGYMLHFRNGSNWAYNKQINKRKKILKKHLHTT